MVVVEDLMGEAKRVASLFEAEFNKAVAAAAATDALAAATASARGSTNSSGGSGGSDGVPGAGAGASTSGSVGAPSASGKQGPMVELDCECIGLGGNVTRVQVLASPPAGVTTPIRVPVKHSPSRYGFPPLAVDCVDDVFAKCVRLAHLRTSLFGVYDGHFGLEAAEVWLGWDGRRTFVDCSCSHITPLPRP